MAFFDKLKNVADKAKSAVEKVAASAGEAIEKVAASAEEAINKNVQANNEKKEQERLAQEARMEAIRKASAANKERVERQQAEAAEAKRKQEEQEEAARAAELAERKAQREQYVPNITAPEGGVDEKLLYPGSVSYALRLHALESQQAGSDCDSYEEITQEFMEEFMPDYASCSDSFVKGVRKRGIGESNYQLKLFTCLPQRHSAMTDEHVAFMVKGLVEPPEDPEEAAYYFEKLVAVLQKRRTYDRSGDQMFGAMRVMGIYYHRPLRKRLFDAGSYPLTSEAELFDDYGHLKDTGLDFHNGYGTETLYDVLDNWVTASSYLKGRGCKECGACAHWEGDREDWYALHAVRVIPETEDVCTFHSIPQIDKVITTKAEDTCEFFAPCDPCDSM